MMLQWLILLTLFVHNSLALGLYDAIDDHDLWRRGGPSTATTAPSHNSACIKDILILWDNSASVGYGSFKDKVVPFLLSLVKNNKLNVGEGGTQLGFITFSSSDKTRTLLKFGEKTTRDDYVKWLETYESPSYPQLVYEADLVGYLTYMGEAFKLANENFTQTSPFNYRKGVEDVIFLFTDGEPNAGSNKLTKEQKDMAEQYSKTLKEDKKVKIIGLAVGNDEKVKKFNQTIIDLSSKPGKKNEKYYFQTDLTKEDLIKIVDQLVGPLCTPAGDCACKGILTEQTVYTTKGSNAIAEWPEPTLACANQPSNYEVNVSPKGSKSGQAFPEGSHNITYSFIYNDAATRRTKDCIVTIKVAGCECPPTQQLSGVIGPSETDGLAEWNIPEPTCPAMLSSPQQIDTIPTSERRRLSEGEHTIKYVYTHAKGSNAFDITCDVKITMQACKCPTTQTVNAKVQPGDTRVLVAWTEPTPNCTTTPSASNPSSTSRWFPVGQRKLTYKYKFANKQTSFDIKCYVNIVVTGEFCGKTTYDAATHVCCCGKIHKKKPDYQCCGLEYYNTLRESCCNSERAILAPRGKCPVKN